MIKEGYKRDGKQRETSTVPKWAMLKSTGYLNYNCYQNIVEIYDKIRYEDK